MTPKLSGLKQQVPNNCLTAFEVRNLGMAYLGGSVSLEVAVRSTAEAGESACKLVLGFCPLLYRPFPRMLECVDDVAIDV